MRLGRVRLLFFLVIGVSLFTAAVFSARVSALVPTLPPGLTDRGPLTKLTFIHYRRGSAKPVNQSNAKSGVCYGFLAKGAKWKTTENYLVNATASGLTDGTVVAALTAGVDEWERYGGSAIFGTGVASVTATINDNIADGQNVVVFSPVSDPRTIAVTTVWGYFGGPPQTRELVEWDMRFNTIYAWGDATTNNLLMDVQNIATHELGHSAGLADLYLSTCGTQTMYGYSTEGETIKRDLNAGDILGIQTLY